MARDSCRNNSITAVNFIPFLRMLGVKFSRNFPSIFFTMSKTTRSTKTKQKHKQLQPDQFHIGQICYDSTCVTLDLPLDLCCYICFQQKDIFTKKSSQPEKKQKYLHQSNRCQQLWDSSWSAKEKVTNGMLLQHNRVWEKQ